MTSPGGCDDEPLPVTPLRWKNSSWKPRIRCTSSGVSVAATISGRCSTTHSYASSGSNTGGGGSAAIRPASRTTNHAAIAHAMPITNNAVTSATGHALGSRDAQQATRSIASRLGDSTRIRRNLEEPDLARARREATRRPLEHPLRVVVVGDHQMTDDRPIRCSLPHEVRRRGGDDESSSEPLPLLGAQHHVHRARTGKRHSAEGPYRVRQ